MSSSIQTELEHKIREKNEYQKQIKEINKQVKPIKLKKKELEEYVLKMMEKHKLLKLEVDGVTYTRCVKPTTGPIKAELIREGLKECQIRDTTKVLDKIQSKLEVKNRVSLKKK